MKKLIIILILFTSHHLFAEKEIELTPIVLPYDSLNIDEVYGYGATIIARSGNTIYHSTDDGGSWDIALESKTKLNQLYSKDPHTVFAIGDSGLVYRTFDYGASWFDVSHETNLSMNKMAAKDYSEYFVVTKHTIGYFKKDMFSDYKAISNFNHPAIHSIKYYDDSYWYCADFYKDRTTEYYQDHFYYNYWLPYYQFTGDNLYYHRADNYRFYGPNANQYISYNFNIFPTEHGMLYTGNNPDRNETALSFDGLHIVYDRFYGTGGMMINADTINYANIVNDTLNVITKHGLWVWMHYTEIEEDFVFPDEVEYSELGTPNINHVFHTYDNQYYLACENSHIYKAKIVSIPTNVNQEEQTIVEVDGNIITTNVAYKLIDATNYIGQKSNYIQLDQHSIQLENGMHILKFGKGNKFIIKKVIIE